MISATFLIWPMTDSLKGQHRSLQNRHMFPRHGIIQSQINFWKKIFGTYTSNQIVIHDLKDPQLIIDMIDLKRMPQYSKLKNLSLEEKKKKITKAYLNRYQTAISRFKNYGRGALKYGAMEKRILTVYSKNRTSLKRLYRSRIKLRAQAGLADEFFKAAVRAQYYLPYIERVFSKENVPTIISRLAFVESMFNLNAFSKVGAAGIWQFMRGTARHYMHINNLVDERRNPFKASTGAAKLLASNYRRLKSWPLAITAYNHGAAGMSKAIRKVNSRDLSIIVKHYKSSTFGFASSNFYAEFLAASEIFSELIEKKSIQFIAHPYDVASVILPHRWSVQDIIRRLPITVSTLKKYNPCLNPMTFLKYSHRKLPSNFELIVPRDVVNKVHLSLSQSERLLSRKRRG